MLRNLSLKTKIEELWRSSKKYVKKGLQNLVRPNKRFLNPRPPSPPPIYIVLAAVLSSSKLIIYQLGTVQTNQISFRTSSKLIMHPLGKVPNLSSILQEQFLINHISLRASSKLILTCLSRSVRPTNCINN